MKLKCVTLVLVACLSSGCASLSHKRVDDFLDGANANAKSREKRQTTRQTKDRSLKQDLAADSIAGMLNALFKGIFDSDDND